MSLTDTAVRNAKFGKKPIKLFDGRGLYLEVSPAVYGTSMYPAAPQLWHKHTKRSVVGVSDDEVGETYWKVKNGIRLTGMPTYEDLLFDSDIWDVSLLLNNADQQLPDPVIKV